MNTLQASLKTDHRKTIIEETSVFIIHENTAEEKEEKNSHRKKTQKKYLGVREGPWK